jgi:hypothetical protein
MYGMMQIRPLFTCGLRLGILLVVVPFVHVGGQQMHPLPCPAEQASAFDFLVGEWRGVVFDLRGDDSVIAGPIAKVSTKKVLNGCALFEKWHFERSGQTEVDDLVLRAFDAASGRWGYDLATSRNEHVHYDGQLDGGVWRFTYEFGGDKPTRVRITWMPTATGYSEQIARSADAGRTWVSTRHINFSRA